MFEKLKNSCRGFTQIVIAGVVSLVIGVVLLVVGTYLLASFGTSMPKVLTQVGGVGVGTALQNQTNATLTNIFNAGYSAFGMGTVIPIVIVAAAIISIIIGAFAYRGRK